MKNTVSPQPKSDSKRAEKEHVQPIRVSDMGMRRNVSNVGQVKLPKSEVA